MSVVVVIRNDQEAEPAMCWAAHFARGLNVRLVVLALVRKPGDTVVERLDPAAESSSGLVAAIRGAVSALEPAWLGQEAPDDDDNPPTLVDSVQLMSVHAADPLQGTLDQLGAFKAQLLIIPRPMRSSEADDAALEDHLRNRAPCNTLHLRLGQQSEPQCRRIMVPLSGGAHSMAALRLVHRVCMATEARVKAVYIEPPLGDDATLVGQRILARIVTRALGPHADRVEQHVTLADDVLQGIMQCCNDDDDLVLVGSSEPGRVRRLLFSRISDRLLAEDTVSAVGVLRTAVPRTSRFQQAVERRLRFIVPQLDRTDRVALTERVQSSSQSNFDFVALMSLSTTIAALGLLDNSPAVVIGAMLVAPLMTPLLGAGMALVQGNAKLFRMAIGTVSVGFLLALLIGIVIGWFLTDDPLTAEVQSRGSPNGLHLLVAIASGLAAAYAIGRPNLLSALPGVAIAAALVPPITSSGLALANGHFGVAGGAALLFLTNILAIVLASALTFWLVGIRGPKSRSSRNRWTWAGLAALLVAVITLAFVLT